MLKLSVLVGCLCLYQLVFPLCFSSRHLMVSGLSFKSLSHGELLFVWNIRKVSCCIFLHGYDPVFSTPFIEDAVLLFFQGLILAHRQILVA